MSDEKIKTLINIEECIARLIQHYYDMTNIFGQLYEDVANKITEVQMDLSLFRSRPYFETIEQTMERLLQWGKNGKDIEESKEKKNKTRTRIKRREC